jgi:hypothetical protein
VTRRLLAWAPAAAVAALALVTAPAQVREALERLKESPAGLARTADAARRELRGAAYADALAEAAARIPAGASYAIAVEGGNGPESNWVRCDLAPRIAILLRPERCGVWVPDRRFAHVPALAVLVSSDGAVRLAETRSLLGPLWSGLTGPQEEIPGWIDEPAEGRTLSGQIVVSGWCQERGGRPCASVRVWVDGREVDAARIERFPRPDVQAAVPEIGDSSRAGWRTVFEPGDLAPGTHCVAAALIAADGRHRRVGPWAFTVGP